MTALDNALVLWLAGVVVAATVLLVTMRGAPK